jgi:hypothetical protein
MIENIIEELKSFSRDKLIQKWLEIFKQAPSQSVRREFLIKHLVWEIQAKEKGGYTSQTRKKLESLARSSEQNKEVNANSIKSLNAHKLTIKAGTKLIREYQGKNHEVIVLEKGYQYQNKFYRSLSAIANEITRSRWNGKVFFGIIKAQKRGEV